MLDPIEEQIGSITGVKRIMGKAYDGYALLMIEFLFEKDLNEASQDVRDAISAIRADLPPEMEEPIVAEVQRHRSADRLDGAVVDGAVAGRADATRRSGHHARAALDPRRRRRADRSARSSAS